MTEYVILHPVGDTFVMFEADVDRPVMTPRSQAERTVRRLALERELAQLRAEDGETPTVAYGEPGVYESVEHAITGQRSASGIQQMQDPYRAADETGRRYAGTYVGADGVSRTELHHSERKPGPSHVCECGQAFYDPRSYAAHGQSCSYHLRIVAHPSYEPGAFVNGSAEPRAMR